MSVLCTICARGGSKGVPGKNIRELLGKPLIAYTIEQALRSDLIDRVVVSTDSEEISEVAKSLGAEVPFLRPAHLANDKAPKLPVIQHAVEFYGKELGFTPDYVIDLDPTSPLRLDEDIVKCLHLISTDAACDSVITGYRSNKNPYFNMVEISSDGYGRLSKSTEKRVSRRQDAPIVYAMNASIYVWKTSSLMNQTDVVSGRVKLFEMPDERSVDIDSEVDYKLVENIMTERQRDGIS